jgi:chitin disaccharide deacetylase
MPERKVSELTDAPSLASPARCDESLRPTVLPIQTGRLIVNADDWGRDRNTTDRISDCSLRGSVSSVSAMVFMKDSERAAALASQRGIDAGLHLNFTTPFSAQDCPPSLTQHQQRLTKYLLRHRFAQVMFHPGLARSFEYVVTAQIEEFCRLYGTMPERLDGHHHMHLCANVLWGKLLPGGTLVRRSFSFQPGEKGRINRLYRKTLDRTLSRRHRTVDFLFSLLPFEPQSRMERILSLGREFAIEVETHPVNPEEYNFLMGAGVVQWTGDFPIARGFTISPVNRSRGPTY